MEEMQRIYPTALTPEEYMAREGHRQVRAETACPRCGRSDGLHRHGVYGRGITGGLGQVLRILIARFLCVACRRTVSYLPEFAMSYRLVNAEAFEAFLDGKVGRRDVQSWQSLLEEYRRRMAR
jgi:transposase-like protein